MFKQFSLLSASVEQNLQVQNFGVGILKKITSLIPILGLALFLLGIIVAVFSVRNKGSRRWGIKLAVSEVVITYFLYVGLTLVCDILLNHCAVEYTSRPEQTTVSEEVYYDVMDELKDGEQDFLFFKDGWTEKMAKAGRKTYLDVAFTFAFVSISCGALLFFITKRNAAIRRLAIAGMCVVIPAALFIGYRFLL